MDKIQIHDATTNETIQRDMTDEEVLEFNKFQTKEKKLKKAHDEALAAKEAIRRAVLDKLGLTADEANALLG